MCLIFRAHTFSILNTALEGYASILVVLIGIFLNLLGILSLARHRRKSLFDMLLITVLLSDSLFLICSLMKSVKSWFETFPVSVFHFLSYVMYPGVRFALICSIYFTVALSYSRFNAVTNPVHVRLAMQSRKYTRNYF